MATTEHDQAGTDGRWVEYVPVDDLVPDQRNPKAHSINDLRASLGRFGYAELITLDERTGRIVSGHGRRELLLDDFAAGREPPEGVRVDEDGRWLVPVVHGWLSADDDEAWAYLVASNAIGPKGGWVDELLAEGVGRLAAMDGGLLGIGISLEESQDLLARLSPPSSLDDLEERYGEHDPASLWPVLRFKVPPEQRDRFESLMAGVPEERWFDRLLDLAEAGAESSA